MALAILVPVLISFLLSRVALRYIRFMEGRVIIVIIIITLFKHVVIVQVLILQINQNTRSHVHCLYQGRYRMRCEAVECSLHAVHFVLDRPH